MDSSTRRVARRTLQATYVYGFEQSRELANRKDYSAALQMLELAASVHPERFQVHYNLAAVYARAKNRKGALNALKKATSLGFRDAAALERDQAFEGLRADPAYKRILAQMK